MTGARIDDLVPPLLAAAADGYGGKGAVALMVDMGAVSAVPGLLALVERDERVVRYGDADHIVWLDDQLRRTIAAAVTTLGGPARNR